jgi:hypothetical protein
VLDVRPRPRLADALPIKATGLVFRRRQPVLAEMIETIDHTRRLVGLRVDRETITTFL